MKRYSVLTYIIGDYEFVHEVEEKDPEAEYILVTDNRKLKSDTWTIVYDDSLDGMSAFDKCYTIRFNCHKYCNTDICLRVDGSVRIMHSLKILIDKFEEGNYDFCLMIHPVRYNLADEYDAWVKGREYPREQADRCLQSFKDRGYDLNYRGQFQGCFSISRKGELTDRINGETLAYLKELGHDGVIERVDQMPWSVILNMKYSDLKILPVSEQIFRSYYMQWYRHHTMIPILNVEEDWWEDEKYMFNKKVCCLTLPTPEDKVVEREKDFQLKIVNQERLMMKYRCKSGRRLKYLKYCAVIFIILIALLIIKW